MDVVSVVTPFRGGAQVVCMVFKLSRSVCCSGFIRKWKKTGGQVEVEREDGEVKERTLMYMDDMTGLRT